MTDVSDRVGSPEARGALVLRRAIDALSAGDLAGFLDTYADDAVYRVAGTSNLVGGAYRGRTEIEAFLLRLFEITEGTLALGVVDILGSHNRAVMIFHVTATRQGKSLDDTGTMAFRLNDDGRFAESWLLYSDQAAYDEFYS